MKRGFTLARMARYISMNFESDAMLLTKEETKEDFLVEQTKEYLRTHYAIVDTEIPLLSTTQKTDIAYKNSTKKPFKGIIEAKFIAKWRTTFIEEIFKDILRLVSIENQVNRSTARLILVGGFRPIIENELFKKHGSKGWLKGDKPEFPFLFPFKGGKPIKTNMKDILLTDDFPQSLDDEIKAIKGKLKKGHELRGYKAKLVAKYLPSDVGLTTEEKQDIVDVYIWKVKPL